MIELNGGPVAVKELTVGEIRAWLRDTSQASADLIDALLVDEVSISDLMRMTDLTAERMDELRPSDLNRLRDAAKEVNPDFFKLRGRILTFVPANKETAAIS